MAPCIPQLYLYYTPGDSQVVYHGSCSLLSGAQMSEAYRSVLNLTFDVPAGQLFRQVHHWAADVFIVAIVVHMMRVFFTGAYRKPRDLDLLSGMGLAIAYSVAEPTVVAERSGGTEFTVSSADCRADGESPGATN